MPPELIVLVTKLDKILSSIEGKKGLPDDKLSNIIPSADGSTLPGNETKKIPDSTLKRVGGFFQTGKFAKRDTILKYARNFADGFLPKLSVTLTDALKPLNKSLNIVAKSISGGGGGGGDSGNKLGNLGSIAKNLLVFLPALGAFTYIAMQWGDIDVSTIVKMLTSLGIFFAGIIALNKAKLLISTSLLGVTSTLLQLAGLAGVVMLLRKSLEGWENISLISLGKVGLVLGGIAGVVAALAFIPKRLLLMGVVAFAGIEALALGLGLVLPLLAKGISSLSGVKWEDLGKVVAIITGIGVIAGVLGALAVTGLGLFLAVGGGVFAGILALAYGLSMVLPPLGVAVKSLEGVKWGDLGKAGVIIAGVGALAVVLGLAAPFVAVANLGMSSFSKFVDGITGILNKIVTTITTLSVISATGITGGFAKIKLFIESASSLFTGEGFIGKIGGFVKNIVKGAAASALVAPYIALALEIQTLSNIIVNTVKKINKIGDVGSVTSTMTFIKSFLDGTGIFGNIIIPDNISNIANSLIKLTNIVPTINELANSLQYLGTTLLNVAKINLPSFKIDGITDLSKSLTNLVNIIPNINVLSTSLEYLNKAVVGFTNVSSFSAFESAKTTIDSLNESVNKLKTSFGELDVKSSINIVSQTPLKVDMTTTNEILYKMYQTSIEMISVLKGLQVGGGNNIIMSPGQGSKGIQQGAPRISGFDSFKGSPYSYR